ncbi:tyrosine-type recombinase/integrase [Vibrio sp. R78045]|uniref:tyrosine-type recombinase/integrase n=1 Tax=Vibrio sp. R78045 TaxID=3093868 RepID=UPI0036F4110A
MTNLSPVSQQLISQTPVLKTEVINTPPTLRYINNLRSKSSRVTMGYTLDCFARELNSFYLSNDVNLAIHKHIDISWPHIDNYAISMTLNRMHESGISAVRLNTYLTAIKQSAVFACDLDLISTKELMRIKEIKALKGSRLFKGRPLNIEEVSMLFVVDAPTPTQLRNNAMFAILTGCGLRCSELMELSVSSLLEESGEYSLKVLGKNDKERLVPLSDDVYFHLLTWCRLRDEHNLETDSLFVTMRKGGNPESKAFKARSSIFRIVRQRCLEVFEFKIAPHDLRRTMATLLYKSGVEVSVIQDLMGHSNISTTHRYITKDKQVFKDAVANIRLK